MSRTVLRDLATSWVWSCAAVLLTLAWPALAEARPEARPDRGGIETLRSDVAAVLRREGIPGVGLALVRTEGVVWAGGVGVVSHDSDRAVTADTWFRVGSITKSFIALAAVRLHERGELSLQAPVAELLPDIAMDNRWHDDRPLTIAHLLEHTAGFDDMHFNETFGPLDVERWPLQRVLAVNPRSRKVRWQPGTRMAYANPGYTVAAAALERVSGLPFEEVVAREVLTPLGMEGSFALDDAAAGRLATGYVERNEPTPYRAILHRPAGSLMTSPRDLARLVRLFLQRGELDGTRVVSPELLDRIERHDTLPDPATDIAYGLGNYGDVLHGVVGRGHDGGLPGYVSSYRYFPDLGFGYVVLLPATHSLSAYLEIRQLMFQYLAQDVILPAPPVVEVPPEQLDAYAGYYEFESPRHELLGFAERLLLGLSVHRQGERLILRTAHSDALPGIPLVPTGKGRFRLPGEGGTTIQFRQQDDGSKTLTLHQLYFERRSPWLGHARAFGLRWGVRVLWIALLVFAAGLLMWVGHPRTREAVDVEALLALAPAATTAMALWSVALLLADIDFDTLATRNLTTVLLFGLSSTFAAMAVIGVLMSLRAASMPASRRFYRGLARIAVDGLAVLASLSALGLTAYGAVNHLIGLRTWAW